MILTRKRSNWQQDAWEQRASCLIALRIAAKQDGWRRKFDAVEDGADRAVLLEPSFRLAARDATHSLGTMPIP